MSAENHPELQKIAKVSRALLPVLYVTLLSISLVLLLVPLLTLTSPTATGEPFLGPTWRIFVTVDQIQAGLLTRHDKITLIAFVVVFAGFVLPGLWFAIRLVQSFKNKNVFSVQSVGYARRIAYLYLAYFVVWTVTALATSWTPTGFDVSFNPVFFSRELIVLGLVWLFVWIYEIGAALQHDSEMTI